MTPQEFLKRVESSASDGRITLDPRLADQLGYEAMLRTLNLDRVVITNLRQDSSARRATVHGKTSIPGANDVAITLQSDGRSQQFEIDLPKYWRLADTFPDLPRASNVFTASGEPENHLGSIAIRNAKLRSVPESGAEVIGNAVVSGPLQFLQSLDMSVEQIAVRASVQRDERHCRINLESELGNLGAFGELGVSAFRLQASSELKSGYRGFFQLGATFDYRGFSLQIQGLVPSGEQLKSAVFVATPADTEVVALPVLLQRLNIDLPDTMPGAGNLPDARLAEASIGLSFERREIDSLRLGMALAKPWVFLPGKVSIASGSLQVMAQRPLDSRKRRVAIFLNGTSEIKGAQVPVMYDTINGSLSGQVKQPLALGPLFKQYAGFECPIALPDIHELRYDLNGNRMEAQFWLKLVDGYSLTIGTKSVALSATTLSLSARLKGSKNAQANLFAQLRYEGVTADVHLAIGSSSNFRIFFPRINFGAIAKSLGAKPPKALHDLGLSNVELRLDSSGSFFASAKTDLSVGDLLRALDVVSPIDLDPVTIDQIAISANAASRETELSIKSRGRVEIGHGGHASIAAEQFALRMTAGKRKEVSFEFLIDGTAKLSDELELAIDRLACRWSSGKSGGWQVQGDVSATLLDRSFPMTATIDTKGRQSQLALRYPDAIDLSPDAQMDVKLKGLGINLQRAQSDDGAQWSATSDVVASLFSGFLKARGKVELAAGSLDLLLRINKPRPITFPFSASPKVSLTFSPLRLSLARNSGKGFSVATIVQISNTPDILAPVFPTEPMAGEISATADYQLHVGFKPPHSLPVRFGDRPADAAFTMPEAIVSSFFLRKPRTDSARRRAWQLGCHLTTKKLDNLNAVFGGLDVFRSSARFDVVVSNGLAVIPRSSPFNKVRLRTAGDGSRWTAWKNFSGIGNLSFEVPEFAFDFAGGRWRAKGGVASKGRLAIPLSPVKWLAAKCGLPAAILKAMPDGLPLHDIDIASPDFVATLVEQLGSQNKTVSSAFEKFANALRDGVENLPADFQSYTRLHIPTNFRFDLSVEPTGGAHFAVGVTDNEPIKAVMPSVLGVPPLPGIVGLTLYKVGFGLTHGGTIGVLKFDGWLDKLNIAELGFALLSGKGRDICNRITMRNTVALVPMAAPVPMPLFYDQLSWKYRNLLGMGMEIEAAFPDPDPSVTDWIRLMIALVRFFSSDDYLLHTKGNLPDGMALPFSLGPARLTLPEYLGGASVGISKQLPALRVADTLARGVDGIKAGNAGWLIEAVPLSVKDGKTTIWPRISNIDIAFGPLSFSAVCCVTTDAEFRHVVLKNRSALKKLSNADPEAMLGCTPAAMRGKPYDKGFLILLMGEAGVTAGKVDLFRYRAQFGMALTGPGDFQTAVKHRLMFGPDGAMAIEISGLIQTRRLPNDSGEIAISVAGEVALWIKNSKYALGGRVKIIPGKLFEADIRLSLSDDFYVSGKLRITDRDASISGTVFWDVPGKKRLKMRTRAKVSALGLRFEPAALDIGDLSATMYLSLPGKRYSLFNAGFELDMPPGFTDKFRRGLKSTANKVVGSEVDDGYSALKKAIATQESYEVSLRGIRSWLPTVCNEAIKHINGATTKKRVHDAIDGWAGKNALRRAAALLVKPFAHKEVRDSARPWIDKLKRVHKAANAKVDGNYRTNLKRALRDLTKQNYADIILGEYKKFPGLRVYRHSPILSKQQIKLVKAAIDAIDKLPAATETRVKAERVLRSMPKNKQVLADVRNSIDEGIDTGIPNIVSVGFEKSIRPLLPDDVALRAEVAYRGTIRVLKVETNLWQVDKIPKQIAEAFAKAF